MSEGEENEIQMAECGSCRAIIPIDSKKCPECGLKLSGISEEALGECGACNALVPIDSKSCPECGVFFVADDVMDVLRDWFNNTGIEPNLLFSNFDSDSDGKIDAEELRDGLLKMNLADLPPSQVERLIDEVDSDSDGVISLSELVFAITGEELVAEEESVDEVQDKIDYSENVLNRVMKKYEILDAEKFLEFAKEFDSNDNNYLTEPELKQAAEKYVEAESVDHDEIVEEAPIEDAEMASDEDSSDETLGGEEEHVQNETGDAPISDDSLEHNDDVETDSDLDDMVEDDISESSAVVQDEDDEEDVFVTFINVAKTNDMTIREVFESIDVDEDGLIDGPELQKGILEITGESLSPNDVFKIISVIDEDSDGRLNPIELIAAIEALNLGMDSDRVKVAEDPIELLMKYMDDAEINPAALFAELDPNGDKVVNKEELRDKLKSNVSDTISEEQINDLMNRFDDDNDGNIDMIEFITTLEQHDDDAVDDNASLSSKKEFPSKWQKRMMSKNWKDVVWPLIHSAFVLFILMWVINGTLAPFVDGESGLVELDSEFGQFTDDNGKIYLNGDIYPCDNDAQIGGCKNSFTPLSGDGGELSMPAGFYLDGVMFIALGLIGLIGGLFMQYSVVAGWRAKSKAMNDNSKDRAEVKKSVDEEKQSVEKTNDSSEEIDNEIDDLEETQTEVEQVSDDEIDIGSHIGLVLEDEEIFGVIIEFDDDEGLVTIEEDDTGDLVTGYQDDMFLED